MKNPRSSSPADPWYFHPWPWLLIAGPLTVVIASLATAWIAYKSDDGVVASDYYKRGLLVNRRLPKEPLPTPKLAATLAFDTGGTFIVHPEAGDTRHDTLRVTLMHPATATRETLTLERDARGDYVGALRSDRLGRWTVSFDSPTWPLPTTLVERTAKPGVAGRAESTSAARE